MNQLDESLDAVFSALANAHRRRVIDLLSQQPASIQQLAREIGMSLTAINRHINLLVDAGLLIRRKVGRVTFVSLRRSTMRRVQEWAVRYEATWGTDDETLDNYVAAIAAAENPRVPRRRDDTR